MAYCEECDYGPFDAGDIGPFDVALCPDCELAVSAELNEPQHDGTAFCDCRYCAYHPYDSYDPEDDAHEQRRFPDA